jgi:hypothetical protein
MLLTKDALRCVSGHLLTPDCDFGTFLNDVTLSLCLRRCRTALVNSTLFRPELFGKVVYGTALSADSYVSDVGMIATQHAARRGTLCIASQQQHLRCCASAAPFCGVKDCMTTEYETALETCKTPPGVAAVESVHLCVGNCTTVLPGHFSMAVHNIRRALRPPVFLGACMRLFNDPASYDTSVDEVVEFLEFHKLVGVDHFTIYSHLSVSSALKCSLRSERSEHYQREGAVNVINIEAPVASDLVHPRGQVSTLNDCVYRNKGFYKFYLHMDVDEFVVPRRNEDLLRYIRQQVRDRNMSQIGLRSAFFYREADVGSMLSSNEREDNVFPFTARSKYIAATDDVDVAIVHHVIAFKRNGGTVVADPDHVLLHHCRKIRKCGTTICPGGTSTAGLPLAATVQDDAMARFLQPVEQAVRQRHKLFQLHEDGCLKGTCAGARGDVGRASAWSGQMTRFMHIGAGQGSFGRATQAARPK